MGTIGIDLSSQPDASATVLIERDESGALTFTAIEDAPRESVWIVEEGEYSDYGVLAIFATEEQAKEFTSHRPAATFREWKLNTWVQEQASFRFAFDLAGNIVESEEEAYIEDPEDPEAVHTDRQPWTQRAKEFQGLPDRIVIHVYRGPLDRAKKIASERYTRIRAYLDEAEARINKLRPFAKEGRFEHYLDQPLSVKVAEVLAGLRPLPDPPGSDYEMAIRKTLGLDQ